MKIDGILQEIAGMDILLKVDGKSITINLADLFLIDEANLTKEYSRQAALYAWLGVVGAKADHKASMADLAKDQEYARTDEAYREQFDASGRKMTEPQVKSLILIDKDYMRASANELALKYDSKLIQALIKALDQRADMLISLGSHLRHEVDMTGMNIQEKKYESSLKDLKKVVESHRKKVD